MIDNLTVLVFSSNLEFVHSYIKSNAESVAFWYAPGLSSYSQLNKFVSLHKILIEEEIVDEFKTSYRSQLQNADISTFKSKTLTQTQKLSFYASNDTHVYLFKNILASLNPATFNLYVGANENGSSAAANNGIEIFGGAAECIKEKNHSSLLILGNDWGRAELVLNAEYLHADKNTVCIQESILDLNEKDGRLRSCSVPIFQGLNSLKNITLAGLVCAVIGNPRFEHLTVHPPTSHHKVFINVNFTYGIFEEIRDKWVGDILNICANLNIDYVISQHPRDNGDFSKLNLLKSHPGIVHETIVNSTVVVSRFSALLLEALSLGRPAIYYNPHNEMMDYKFEADNETLFVAKNSRELLECLRIVTSADYKFSVKNQVLNLHLGNSSEGTASKYIIKFLNSIACSNSIKSKTWIEVVLLKLKLFKANVLSK